MAMLEVKDIEVYYGMIQALKGISFEVKMCIRDSGKRAEEAIHLPGRDTSTGLFCVRIKSGVLCAIVWKCVIDRK